MNIFSKVIVAVCIFLLTSCAYNIGDVHKFNDLDINSFTSIDIVKKYNNEKYLANINDQKSIQQIVEYINGIDFNKQVTFNGSKEDYKFSITFYGKIYYNFHLYEDIIEINGKYYKLHNDDFDKFSSILNNNNYKFFLIDN